MTKPIKSLNLFCLPVTFYVNKTNVIISDLQNLKINNNGEL